MSLMMSLMETPKRSQMNHNIDMMEEDEEVINIENLPLLELQEIIDNLYDKAQLFKDKVIRKKYRDYVNQYNKKVGMEAYKLYI